eukprot:m.603055 g.603055  ORF g.603055 m.603055 type:complete len:57 (+) comp58099_c0_seq3:1221-1391(+)
MISPPAKKCNRSKFGNVQLIQGLESFIALLRFRTDRGQPRQCSCCKLTCEDLPSDR